MSSGEGYLVAQIDNRRALRVDERLKFSGLQGAEVGHGGNRLGLALCAKIFQFLGDF